MRQILILCALAASLGASTTAIAVDPPTTATPQAASADAVQQAVAGSWRDPKNSRARPLSASASKRWRSSA